MRVEQSRDLRDDERERRKQAAGVSAWGIRKGDDDWTLQLLNGSDAAVFDVEVKHQTLGGTRQDTRIFRTLPPGRFTVVKEQFKKSGQAVDYFNLSVAEDTAVIIPGGGQRMVSKVTFTDAHGVKWERTPAGLNELPS